MANLIARAQGFTESGNPKASEATRLGHKEARASVATWVTTATVYMLKDGSGEVLVRRNGKDILFQRWEKETSQ